MNRVEGPYLLIEGERDDILGRVYEFMRFLRCRLTGC